MLRALASVVWRPMPSGLSPAAQDCLRFEIPHRHAINAHDYPTFIEILNCRDPHWPELANVNYLHRIFGSLISQCSHGKAPAMLAELLKRGANANIKEYSLDDTEYSYPAIEGTHENRRWTIRLLLLYGAKFDMRGYSTGPYSSKINQSALEYAASTFSSLNIPISHYTQEDYYQYGPVPNSSLLSQQLVFLANNNLFVYFQQIQQEVQTVITGKHIADIHFKNERYLLAAIAYHAAGQLMAQFAGDHIELEMFYFAKALEYYHNAALSYQQLFMHEVTPENRGRLLHYTGTLLEQIADKLQPKPVVHSANPIVCAYLKCVEDVRATRTSAVLRAILQEQAFLNGLQAQYASPVMPRRPSIPLDPTLHDKFKDSDYGSQDSLAKKQQ